MNAMHTAADAAQSGLRREDRDDFLTSAQVRHHFGGISEMTLWRWTRDIGFPKPDKVIQRRKFWRRSTIAQWNPPERVAQAAA